MRLILSSAMRPSSDRGHPPGQFGEDFVAWPARNKNRRRHWRVFRQEMAPQQT
ncbi:hypothetical protein N7516_007131 [Penicillium verrucosum]|uniref:uncharacterized protein n=1 Tax=Penicillium verrucosum TaxID=60171 RepID=UPI002545A6DC|nr:uncharacterized protein N7516_007131 [Penicillium verrucosum]KAJ5932642.1 hypothetical protein N7516_007131 [Penicillium verrucosum]